jgi:hypothetical protein
MKKLLLFALSALVMTGCRFQKMDGPGMVGHADSTKTDSTQQVGLAADTLRDGEPSSEEQGMAPYQQEVMDIEEMPKTAERKDSHMQFAVYINKESAESEEGAFDAIYSVWLADERTGTVKKVCQTNPTTAPIWEQMKGKDPDAASTELQLIATAERAWIAPGDVSKVIVEGCPDGRNIWTYIIDTNAHTVKQLPSTEGVQDLDWNAKEIIVASYGYDDDGRYSFKRVYNIDGKFLRRTGEIERE